MPLVKTRTLLRSLKTARTVMKDPVATAHLFSSDGLSAAMKGGMTEHPFCGLWLWAEAYASADMTRAITKAAMAMQDLHRELSRVPPDQWEAQLRDPNRAVEGYSIDTLSYGPIPIDPEYARQLITERLEAKRNPLPPAPPPHRLASRDAWIKPTGAFIAVGHEQHISWCAAQEPPLHEGDIEKAGWIKVSQGRVTLYRVPTKRQMTILWDWCEHHGKAYAKVEDAAESQRLERADEVPTPWLIEWD